MSLPPEDAADESRMIDSGHVERNEDLK